MGTFQAQVKTCRICNKEKNVDQFYKSTHYKDGCETRCKSCQSEYQNKWKKVCSPESKERRKETDREYRKNFRTKNPEKIKEWKRRDYCRRKKEIAQAQKIYYEKNKKIRIQHVKEWCLKNPDKIKEYRKRTYGKLETKAWFHNRRALKRLSAKGIKITKEDLEIMYRQQNERCFYCNEELNKKYDLEHIVPISKGGEHRLYNLVLSCRACNAKKFNKDPEQFVNEILKVA